jgi:hypothetical protein
MTDLGGLLLPYAFHSKYEPAIKITPGDRGSEPAYIEKIWRSVVD